MTAAYPDEKDFETHRDIPIRVNENGQFVIHRLPYGVVGPMDEGTLAFPNVRAARKAIDDDIAKARAEASGQSIEVWLLYGDKPRLAIITGIHGGTGRPVAHYADGGEKCEIDAGFGFSSRLGLFTTEAEALRCAAADFEAREATKRAHGLRGRLSLAIEKDGRIGPEKAVAMFLALRAKVEEHRRGFMLRADGAADGSVVEVGDTVESVNTRSEAFGLSGVVQKVEGREVYAAVMKNAEDVSVMHFFIGELKVVQKAVSRAPGQMPGATADMVARGETPS